MNFIQTALNVLTFGLSVSTAGSVLIHDTSLDKVAVAAATSRSSVVETIIVAPNSKPHTHHDRGSLHQAVRDLNASQPRIQPRNQGRNKYMQAKPSARGHHPFDNYTLPMID